MARIQARADRRAFVLLSEERIGADRLAWTLKRHAHVRVHAVNPAHEADAREWARALREALTAPAGKEVAVGVRTGIGPFLDPRAVEAPLRELRPRIVHVIHTNLVRATIFSEVARASRAWVKDWQRVQTRRRSQPSPPPLPRRPTAFSPQRFTSTLRRIEIRQVRLRRFVDDLGLPFLRLTEEELLASERSARTRVLRHLGVDPLGVDEPELTRADGRYLALYEDLDVLRLHLEDTPYEPMLRALRSE